MIPRPPTSTLFPYTTLFRSQTVSVPTSHARAVVNVLEGIQNSYGWYRGTNTVPLLPDPGYSSVNVAKRWSSAEYPGRSEEHTSELQSRGHLVCRLLLEKKKK